MAVSLQDRIRQFGFFTLGAGDAAAETARQLSRTPFELPGQVRQFAARGPVVAQQRYDELTDRGRKVAASFRTNPTVKEVVGRAEQFAGKARERVPVTPLTPAPPAKRSTRYENRTLDELQELAAERDIEGRSGMKKAELIAALRAGE